MEPDAFRTTADTPVPAVTAAEMAAVDRVATDEVGLALAMMMENAGRNLANAVRRENPARVTVVAGTGGNGGGGMACARHLANRGVDVSVVLSGNPDSLEGTVAQQYAVLGSMDISFEDTVEGDLVVDTLIGYGLSGAVREDTVELIETMNESERVVSLDVPSGIDATTGEVLGTAVRPETTVTLALPKTGLRDAGGTLLLADIGIPMAVYKRAGLSHDSPFGGSYLEEIVAVKA